MKLMPYFQKCRVLRRDVFACFINYGKAFDRVHQSKLVKMLYQTQLDSRDIRIIENLYWGQSSEVTTGLPSTPVVEIRRGELLFNLYSDKIFKGALKDMG